MKCDPYKNCLPSILFAISRPASKITLEHESMLFNKKKWYLFFQLKFFGSQNRKPAIAPFGAERRYSHKIIKEKSKFGAADRFFAAL